MQKNVHGVGSNLYVGVGYALPPQGIAIMRVRTSNF